MKTQAQVQAMSEDPLNVTVAMILAERIINQEMQRIISECQIETEDQMKAALVARATYRLAMMTTVAAKNVEDLDKECEHLKDELARLTKQALPKAM